MLGRGLDGFRGIIRTLEGHISEEFNAMNPFKGPYVEYVGFRAKCNAFFLQIPREFVRV